MNCREARSRIDEDLDGELAPSERAELEAHLRACARCRREAEGLRALLAEAAALPARVPPERDLWPEIRAEIRRRKVVRLEPRAARAWPRRAALVAAAVALVAISSTLTMILRQPRDDLSPTAGVPAPPDAAVLAGVDAWEVEVVRATRELTDALASGGEGLSPATIAILERNLRIIDDAIRESRAALERDPGNAALGQMLWATYKKKLDLLQQAARWSVES